jgi:murein DD-endopeptidase MepM/ murein hydrolase activator NlpD
MTLLRILAFAVLMLSVSLRGGVGETLQCTDGVEAMLRTSSPIQGELQVLEIRSKKPLIDIQAAWAGQTLQFWKEYGHYRALMGVDLSMEPKTYQLALSVVFEGGERVGCSLPVQVQEGQFVVQKLTVEPKFVELSNKDLERSRREARRQRSIFRSVTPERLWKGEFQLPNKGFKGSGNFGKRRVFNEQPRSPHTGEDFSAVSGTPIPAVQRGRVALADNLFFSGNAVIIDHGLGLYSFYGHMKTIAVKEGDVVEAGTILGEVGATGRVTGPHLHLTIRLGNARVNPRGLLKIH